MQGGGCYIETGIIFVLKSGILCSSVNFFSRHNNISELMIKTAPWRVALFGTLQNIRFGIEIGFAVIIFFF